MSHIRDRKPSWEESRGASQNWGGFCLKQDLQDFGGFSGLRASRLMVGRRVFFAAGERAGCGGEIIGDAPMYTSLAPSWH